MIVSRKIALEISAVKGKKDAAITATSTQETGFVQS